MPPGVEIMESGLILLPPIALKRSPPPPIFSSGGEAGNAENRGISAESRILLRGRAEEKIGWEPKLTSAESRSGHRGSAEEKIGAEPIFSSGPSRSWLRGPAEADFRQRRQLPITSTSSDQGKGVPPAPDLELEAWKRKYRTAYEREIAPVRSELQAGLAAAADADKEWFRVRLDYLKTLRTGGKPPAPARSAAKAAPAKAAPKPEQPMTDEELLEAGRFLVGARKKRGLKGAALLAGLSQRQRELIAQHGAAA